MESKPSLTLYNPDLLPKADLIRGFIARQPMLRDLLDDLRRAGAEGAPQHHILLGQRGLGKTTLLRRRADAIEDDPELAAIWQPLTFPEEQYNVAKLADFWLNCADALSDALDRAGRTAEAQRIDDRVEQLPEKTSAAALARLMDEAARLGPAVAVAGGQRRPGAGTCGPGAGVGIPPGAERGEAPDNCRRLKPRH